MAKVKIILEKDETLEDVKEELVKAFTADQPNPKQFRDPVLEDVHKKLDDKFANMYTDMFKEILEIMKHDDETLKQIK